MMTAATNSHLHRVQRNATGAARSSQMIMRLRENMLYSEKRARDMLFDAIQDIVSHSNPVSPLTLSQLIRTSAGRARLKAQNEGYEFSNWAPASQAVANGMLHAGAFLGPDAMPLCPDLSAQSLSVCGLREDFRDLTESYLIEFLIADLGDIGIRDHTSLTHVLYRQFDRTIPMEMFEDRVVMLLATLKGRVALRKDGVYCIDRRA